MRIKLRTTAVAPRQAMTAAISEAKARQLSKIRELRLALRRAGLIGLDEQAQALGLPRSTTWKILKGGHRASGFSAMVISRMLSEPRLPPVVRIKILEYVQEKADELYGHGKSELLRFLGSDSVRQRGGEYAAISVIHLIVFRPKPYNDVAVMSASRRLACAASQASITASSSPLTKV